MNRIIARPRREQVFGLLRVCGRSIVARLSPAVEARPADRCAVTAGTAEQLRLANKISGVAADMMPVQNVDDAELMDR